MNDAMDITKNFNIVIERRPGLTNIIECCLSIPRQPEKSVKKLKNIKWALISFAIKAMKKLMEEQKKDTKHERKLERYKR